MTTENDHDEHDKERDLVTIATLYEHEPNRDLQIVLGRYRAAEAALQSGIDHLRVIGRERWALAMSSCATSLQVQANRYIRAARLEEARSVQAVGLASAPEPESAEPARPHAPRSLLRWVAFALLLLAAGYFAFVRWCGSAL